VLLKPLKRFFITTHPINPWINPGVNEKAPLRKPFLTVFIQCYIAMYITNAGYTMGGNHETIPSQLGKNQQS
jgi:hypothetical protein